MGITGLCGIQSAYIWLLLLLQYCGKAKCCTIKKFLLRKSNLETHSATSYKGKQVSLLFSETLCILRPEDM